MCRKLLVFLSLFLVLSSSVFALAPLKGSAKTIPTAQKNVTETSSDLSEISKKIDSLLLVKQDTKDELNEKVDQLYNKLQKAEKENTKTKFFADLGVAFGLKEKSLQYGMMGDVGLKFGKGLLVKMGAVYMIGNDFKNISWGLDNLTATATVGWEW